LSLFSSIYTYYLTPTSSPKITDFENIVNATNISVIQNLKKYLNFLFVLFAIPGLFYYISNNIKCRKDLIYTGLSIIFLSILVVVYFYPLIGATINLFRTIQIMLIITAPLSIYGIYSILKIFALKMTTRKRIITLSLCSVISVLCIILFLLNIGLVYEFTDDPPSSYSLNLSNRMDREVFSQGELLGIEWSDKITEEGGHLIGHSSIISAHSRMKKIDGGNFLHFPSRLADVPEKSAVFLRKVNILDKKIYSGFSDRYPGYIEPLIHNKNKIYCNGDSEIYL